MTDAQLATLLQPVWIRAKAHWSAFFTLSLPINNPYQSSLAQIDLGTRQISLNEALIRQYQRQDCLEVLLAHEMGHHLRYPGSLETHARLLLLEQSQFGWGDFSLTHLFADWMINSHLGTIPALRTQLIALYQTLPRSADLLNSAYRGLYEVLWQLPAGTLMDGQGLLHLQQRFPAYRQTAHQLVEYLGQDRTHIYRQFLYFASQLAPYIDRDDPPAQANLADHLSAEPAAEDWAAALSPTNQEKAALAHATQAGWIKPASSASQPLTQRIAQMTSGRHSHQARQIMAAYYYQQAQRHLLQPPPQRQWGEPIQPTGHEDWLLGDAVAKIDWLATFVQRGAELGQAQPLQRGLSADREGGNIARAQPRIEIYLDTSGSMPDPCLALNTLTLAAQVLMLGAIRAGGWARILLYSSAEVTLRHWQWCRSEMELVRFSMQYLGAGTVFPFAQLAASVAECGLQQPVRVIISDNDFDDNYDREAQAPAIVQQAIQQSPQLVLLLHRYPGLNWQRYEQAGAQVIPVDHLADFPLLSSQLSHHWFGVTINSNK